jgi:tight adherence protein C
MILLLILGLIVLAAAVVLLVRGWTFWQTSTSDTIAQIGSYGFSAEAQAETESAPGTTPRQGLSRLADNVGSFAERFVEIRGRGMREQLIAAGMYETDPIRILGYRVLAATAFPIIYIWFGFSSGMAVPLMVLGAIAFGVGGWLLPPMMIARRARSRLEQIDYELPELIDLLVVTLEAGIGFLPSLHMAADRLEGPLGTELRLTLQEQRFGLTTNEALQNMLARCETDGLRSFIRSIMQGETLGVSTGQIMRNLAVEMRKRRKASAEERAQKAPIKILFPLVFLIFPAMFIVLLGPVAYSLGDALGGK